MSHAVVMVVGSDVEGQMEPYYEGRETPRYRKHTKAELIAKGREEIEAYKNGTYAEFMRDPEEYRAKHGKNEAHIKHLETFHERFEWTDEQVYADQIRYYEAEDIGEEGEVYSTYNPNSKWDWYVVGGRWAGALKLKEGAQGEQGERSWSNKDEETPEGHADIAKKGDIDWAGMKAERIATVSKWYDEYLAKVETGEFKADEYCWAYDVQPNETREAYIARRGTIAPLAILKDGQWYEKGELGWWGVVHDEMNDAEWEKKFEELMADISDEEIITMIDYHI